MSQDGRPGAPGVPPTTGAALRTLAPRAVEGRLDGRGLTIAIACARFHESVCDRLLEGALVELTRLSVPTERTVVARVPGAFELPVAALHLARDGADAVICLGAVIRGETPHFEYVAGAAAGGIARVAEQTGIPILFGVLTADTRDQALERAGGRHGNKGSEAAAGAVEMANLIRALRSRSNP